VGIASRVPAILMASATHVCAVSVRGGRSHGRETNDVHPCPGEGRNEALPFGAASQSCSVRHVEMLTMIGRFTGQRMAG